MWRVTPPIASHAAVFWGQKKQADFTVGNIYLLTNISECTAFLLQDLTYNETLHFESVQYDIVITSER